MVQIDGNQTVKEVKLQQTEIPADPATTASTPKKDVKMTDGQPEAPGDNVSFNKTKQKIATKAETLDYSNFGGKKEAAAASTLARNVLDAVNDELKSFQKQFPGVIVDIDEFPAPTNFSKKTYGKDGAYQQWQQAVSEWRNNATDAIHEAQNSSIKDVISTEGEKTRETLTKQQEQIVQQMVDLEQITMEEFNTLYAQNNHNFSKTIAVIRAEGSKTRATERAEGAKTRDVVMMDGNYTRAVVRGEGFTTRLNDNINNANTNEHIDQESKNTRTQQKQLANEIMKKLNSMPDKKSIAKDILIGQLKLPAEILKQGIKGLISLPLSALEQINKALQ